MNPAAWAQLSDIARINAVGTETCWNEYKRYRDDETAELLARSIAYSCQQVFHAYRELILEALRLEEAASKQLS